MANAPQNVNAPEAVEVRCPSCGAPVSLTAGPAACGHCGATVARSETKSDLPPVAVPSGSLFGEFWRFLKEEKKWWLAPILLVVVTLGAFLIFAESSAIAPFIYSIF